MIRTQVQYRRDDMELNSTFVQQHAKMYEQEYKQFIYDLGIQFLEVRFKTAPQHIQTLEKSKLYWKWWRNEFFQFEKGLLINHDTVANEHSVPVILDRALYLSEMEYITTDKDVWLSFRHLVSILKYKHL